MVCSLCEVEHVAPTDILTYMLTHNAVQVHSRMMVGEASDWEVVKAALTAEYAMPRQEAWRRYTDCWLEASETVDIYLPGLSGAIGRQAGFDPQQLGFQGQVL